MRHQKTGKTVSDKDRRFVGGVNGAIKRGEPVVEIRQIPVGRIEADQRRVGPLPHRLPMRGAGSAYAGK
jgi:hypothetical protein